MSQKTPTGTNSTFAGNKSSFVEGVRGIGCGVLYGLTSPLVGHPIDTVKTKMQAQDTYFKGSAVRTLVNVVKNEGFFALYRGLLPPLLGSGVFRSIQFGAFSAAYAGMRDDAFCTSVMPGMGGMEYRVLFAGLFSSTCRSVIETPLELIKVRQQVGHTWRVYETLGESIRNPIVEIKNLFSGFGVTWIRTAGLMCSFFMLNDHVNRHFPEVANTPVIGSFVKGGLCSTIAWWIIWPFENLKNQVQADNSKTAKNMGWLQRARVVMTERGGFLGLYRGIGPGSARSLIANGFSMMAFQKCQEVLRTADE